MKIAGIPITPDRIIAALALLAAAAGLWRVVAADAGLEIVHASVGAIPVTVHSRPGAAPGPAVVIVHGYALSRQIMRPLAATLARSGYTAVTLDLPGHGGNRLPLTGAGDPATGAPPAALIDSLSLVIAYARALPRSDGRLALVGHSKSADLVVRVAQTVPDVAATIAVSLLSPAVTGTTPRNLLVLVGAWEPDALNKEAIRVVGLVPGVATAETGTTVGSFANGTARRAAVVPSAGHIGVLYSRAAQTEARDWLNAVFARDGTAPVDRRGPGLIMLLLSIVLLARPLTALLPLAAPVPVGGGGPWGLLAAVSVAPTVFGPVILRMLPDAWAAESIGGYLAAHFALFGLLTGFGLWLAQRRTAPWRTAIAPGAALLSVMAIAAYGAGGLGLAVDRLVTTALPQAERLPLMLMLLAGTLPYCLADEWLTRGPDARRGAYAATKGLFALSLLLAVAVDFERLLFLILVVPLLLLLFGVFGLFSGWAYRRTNHPLPGALANAVLLAAALAAMLPGAG